VKTVQFKDPVYVGDPLNAVKIFNEKEVDELIVLDISASADRREPDYEYIEQIATECFMPVTYGGGVHTIESFHRVISCGVEKVAVNTSAINQPELIREAADKFGSSSVVAAMDVKKDFLRGTKVYVHTQKKLLSLQPVQFAKEMEKQGAGEILLQSVDRDGMMKGYDTSLIHEVTAAVNIPVIVCGGAGVLSDFSEALKAGASAVAAGSKFVFWGKHRAVLINYLSTSEINQLTSSL
jgi:cyclase